MRHRPLALLLLTVILVVHAGCSDDAPPPTGPPAGIDHRPRLDVGAVFGTIDGNWGAVDEAAIELGERTLVSDPWGRFEATAVPVGQHALAVASPGHLTVYRSVDVQAARTTATGRIRLQRLDAHAVADQGATFSSYFADVTVPEDGFVTASGPVAVEDLVLDVEFLASHGQDFVDAFGPSVGVRASGEEVRLVGTALVAFFARTEQGEPAELAPGAMADLAMEVDHVWAGDEATIPLWHFDPSTRRWQERGTAVRDSLWYRGEFDRTGRWAVAEADPATSAVTGMVVDRVGAPVAGATVRSWMSGPAWSTEAVTDASGRFALDVLEGDCATLRVHVDGEWSYGGFVCLDGGMDAELANPLVVSAPVFRLTLVWGADPPDLDAHLFVPRDWDPAFDLHHVFFDERGDADEPPHCRLGDDATSGYGPEAVVGYRWRDGRYQYWIHDYSHGTSASLRASGARVQVMAAGEAWILEVADTPPPVGEDPGWWHVCDLVADGGAVTVEPVDRFGVPPSGPGVFSGETKRGSGKTTRP
ncbi:hypothetical protein GF314_12415 [bacterium]|nr:hypothetical protein [bacterium]